MLLWLFMTTLQITERRRLEEPQHFGHPHLSQVSNYFILYTRGHMRRKSRFFGIVDNHSLTYLLSSILLTITTRSNYKSYRSLRWYQSFTLMIWTASFREVSTPLWARLFILRGWQLIRTRGCHPFTISKLCVVVTNSFRKGSSFVHEEYNVEA